MDLARGAAAAADRGPHAHAGLVVSWRPQLLPLSPWLPPLLLSRFIAPALLCFLPAPLELCSSELLLHKAGPCPVQVWARGPAAPPLLLGTAVKAGTSATVGSLTQTGRFQAVEWVLWFSTPFAN